MTDFTDDRIAYPHMVNLGASIEQELEARGLPGLCDTLLGAGAEMAFDQCSTECDGMAWVRLANAFSSQDFPIADMAASRSVILMAETFEIGLVRGIELPDRPQDGMDPDVLRAAARQQLADMSALLAVMCGYFRSKGIPFMVGQYQPYGPAGGCVGGSWTVTAQTGVAPKPRP